MNSAPQRPRIWPSLVVLLGALPAVIAAQIVVVVAMLAFVAITEGKTAVEDTTSLESRLVEPGPFLVLLVVSQLVYGALALLPARLSPRPFRERLGLVPARVSPAQVGLLMLATLFVWQVGGLLLVTLFDGPSEHIAQFGRTFAEAPLPWAIVLVLAASVLPGICEELLCRGYAQRRLLERWPPVLAIGFTSLVFAAMHMDPQHILGVVPFALWVGYVAWRTGSTWPGIACHFFMNAIALGLGVAFEDPEAEWAVDWSITGPVLGVSSIAFVLAVRVLERRGRATGASTV